MPTVPPEPRRDLRARAVAGTVLAALLALTGCSGGDPAPEPEPPARGGTSRAGESVEAPDVARAISRLLERRVDAVRRGDRTGFLRGVAPAARGAQTAYFDGLTQLPLEVFDVRLDRASLLRVDGDYWAEVDVRLRLGGYDSAPVVSRDRYRFTRGRDGRVQLASMTDRVWEERHGVVAQPWETGRLTVVEGNGVLGLFDDGSAGRAAQVMADVEAGVAAVSAQVPYEWDGRVVVYALADPGFLAGLDGLPGDDPLALDAVTFPVPVAPGADDYAGTRFVLNPRMVATPGPARNRLVRHELTHVALGERQDGAPTWFAEGLAEYVSVQPLAPQDRAVSEAALAAAERGLRALPDDETFNGPDSQANYGVAWWACEYLAQTYDESTLWVLLDAMGAGEEPTDVLESVLQLDERTLARKAGRLMLATYRPQPEEEPEPSDRPDDDASDEPSEDPTDEESDGTD